MRHLLVLWSLSMSHLSLGRSHLSLGRSLMSLMVSSVPLMVPLVSMMDSLVPMNIPCLRLVPLYVIPPMVPLIVPSPSDGLLSPSCLSDGP